jgi:hypothetical protein
MHKSNYQLHMLLHPISSQKSENNCEKALNKYNQNSSNFNQGKTYALFISLGKTLKSEVKIDN